MVRKTLSIAAIGFCVLNVILLIVFLKSESTGASSSTTAYASSSMNGYLNLASIHIKPERIGSDTCIACHGDMKQLISTSKTDSDGLNYHIHQTLKDKEFTCTYCHRANRVWSKKVRLPKIKNSIETYVINDHSFCFECHIKLKQATHVANWRAIHGKRYIENRDFCRLCHVSDFCSRCHINHPAAWRNDHPKDISKHGLAFCMRCHYDGFCRACHNKEKVKTLNHAESNLK